MGSDMRAEVDNLKKKRDADAELLTRAREIIESIGTTDCGCNDTRRHRRATQWLEDLDGQS